MRLQFGKMQRLYCILVGPLIFFWIISSSQHRALSARRNAPNSTDNSEDVRFVEKYGNDYNTSGLWEPVRNILDDYKKVQNMCTQAHLLIFEEPPRLTATGFYIKELKFPNSPQYQPIELDVVVYTFDELEYQDPRTPHLYHFTKGLESHCIYYVVPLDPKQFTVKLQEHVCGMQFPFET